MAAKTKKMKSIHLDVSRPLELLWFHLSFSAKFLQKNSNLFLVEPIRRKFPVCKRKMGGRSPRGQVCRCRGIASEESCQPEAGRDAQELGLPTLLLGVCPHTHEGWRITPRNGTHMGTQEAAKRGSYIQAMDCSSLLTLTTLLTESRISYMMESCINILFV